MGMSIESALDQSESASRRGGDLPSIGTSTVIQREVSLKVPLSARFHQPPPSAWNKVTVSV
jgi:hypothetical protein